MAKRIKTITAGRLVIVGCYTIPTPRSSDRERQALLFAVLHKIVMETPALVILNLIWPLYGLAYAQTVAEVILSIAAVLVLRHIFQNLGNPPEKEARAKTNQ